MAAIAEELLGEAPEAAGDAPEVSVSVGPAGRETLALIAEAVQPVRPVQTTLSYGDRISNAPGAKTPSRMPGLGRLAARAPSQASAPEIKISESELGRETMAVIAAELAPSTRDVQTSPSEPSLNARAEALTIDDTASESPFAIFEMLTFVVQGPEVAHLSSDALRRRFVEEHLLQRLPAKDMSQVDRVDVTPWTVRGTVVVRVWCKV